MNELPLFPLQTVLFPEGRIALRVFEPRYLDMVARCLRGENRFGVIAIREGSEVGAAATTHEIGTTAEIVDWHQENDGLLGILAAGRVPFRLIATRREPDGLYLGEIDWLPPSPPLPLPAVHEPLVELLERLLAPLPLYRGVAPVFDDAAWVGGRLIELLPLGLPFKQSLLEMTDAGERLDRLAAALEASRGSEGSFGS
jgi:Lon protease-like protein